MLLLPPNHAQRIELQSEIHARPYEPLSPPEQVSHIALITEETHRPLEHACLYDLCKRFNITPPKEISKHLRLDLGRIRLRYERHTEFTSYTLIKTGAFDDPFNETAIQALPADWLQTLPGEMMVATHIAIQTLPDNAPLPHPDELHRFFNHHSQLIATQVGEGVGIAFTDFQLHNDGFCRFLLYDLQMTPRQAGRMMQRLLEIATYMLMAMRAFPVAQQLTPTLTRVDHELAQITAEIREAERDDETLLNELSLLAAEVENCISSSEYRFGAARAYYALVETRIRELRELRVQGVQTFREFVDRRLAPAMSTCESVSRRQENLSKRVNRASQLLRTRVDIAREQQNQALLASMDNRAKLQLHLQETVEGLSVAAITYYTVGLISYFAKGLKDLSIPLSVDIVTGASIPLVALVVALGVRHIRHRLLGGEHK